VGIDAVTLRPAIFLDRDGVINSNVLDPATGEYGAPLTADRFQLAPRAIEGLHLLQRANFSLFLISNQPNYAKGKSTLEELAAIHCKMQQELEAAGISFLDFYYCYHHPQGKVAEYSGPCECRKPSPYFLYKAKEEHGISFEASWMIGDRVTDIECGRAAGLRTIRVVEDHPAQRRPDEIKANFEAVDLVDAARIVLEHSESK
jgi:D-glycero-D-manno-heptose 1,7-bisphosphate phosphatase